jgi:hypothetical protein
MASALSPARQWAASGCLVAAATVWTGVVVRFGGTAHGALPWTLWNLAVAGMLAAASAGIARRAMLPQVFARGVVALAVVWAALMGSSWGWAGIELVIAGLSIAALRLAQPGLTSDAARAEFAPVAYRRVFLMGAMAAVVVGVNSAFTAVWDAVALISGHPQTPFGWSEVWGPGLLAVAYLTSVVGVVRMRAWGVLLGVGTAVGSILCALPVRHEASLLGLAYVCVPGAILAAPLVAARLRKEAPVRVRIASGEMRAVRLPDEVGCEVLEAASIEEDEPKLARQHVRLAG